MNRASLMPVLAALPAGNMNLPVHFTVIPDTSGSWRLGATIGVNW